MIIKNGTGITHTDMMFLLSTFWRQETPLKRMYGKIMHLKQETILCCKNQTNKMKSRTSRHKNAEINIYRLTKAYFTLCSNYTNIYTKVNFFLTPKKTTCAQF